MHGSESSQLLYLRFDGDSVCELRFVHIDILLQHGIELSAPTVVSNGPGPVERGKHLRLHQFEAQLSLSQRSIVVFLLLRHIHQQLEERERERKIIYQGFY